MIARSSRRGALVLTLVLAAGCRGHGADTGAERGAAPGAPSSEALRCDPAAPDPASLAGVDDMAGTYRLVLVAGSGPAAGGSVGGTLHLVATDSAAAPFLGWTDAPVEQLGASVPGDAGSREPAAPGVRVLVGPAAPGSAGPPPVTIRLGSHANREGPPLFDEAWAVLHVGAIGSSRFSGTWTSGGARSEVEGHFCAAESRDVGPS